jgi:hypothetical protein
MKVLSVFLAALFIFAGCEKKNKDKFGVHDKSDFLQQCDCPIYSSIFQEPKEDPFRQTHLKVLKQCHPEIFEYAMKHAEIHSRELMLVAKIHEKFPILADQSIVFIGASDGEIQRLFFEVFHVEKIKVIDLKPCLELAARKLFELPIEWLTPEQIKSDLAADLVISVSAFSHLNESWQKHLFEHVIAKAKAGALYYQMAPRHWGVKPWKKERFLKNLKSHHHVEEAAANSLTADISSLILFAR